MPTVTIAGRGEIDFPQGVTDEEIREVVDREFPVRGQDVEQRLQEDVDYVPTFNDYATYSEWMRNGQRETDWKETMATGFRHMLNTVGAGLKNSLQLESFPGVVEGFAQGSRGMWEMVAQSQNPDSIAFGLKSWALDNINLEDEYNQFLEAREFGKRSMELLAGDDTLVVPKEYVNNKFVQGVASVADVTSLVPFLGQFGKISRIGAVAKMSTAAETLAAKGSIKLGAGLKKAGGGITGAADKVATGIEAASGLKKPIQTAAAGLGMTASSPVIATTAKILAGAAAAKTTGEILETAGKAALTQPSRMSILNQAYGNLAGSMVSQQLARAALFAGGDTALDLAPRMALGAAQGALIGGGMGYVYDGDRGLAGGVGGGVAMGGVMAGVGRTLSHLTGAVEQARIVGDFDTYLEALPDAMRIQVTEGFSGRLMGRESSTPAQFEVSNQRELARRLGQYMEAGQGANPKDGIRGAMTLMADVHHALTANGGRLMYIDSQTMDLPLSLKKVGGSKGFEGVYYLDGETPTIVIDIARAQADTPAHELAHVMLKTVSSEQQLSMAVAHLFGETTPDGKQLTNPVIDQGALKRFATQYGLNVRQPELWNRYIAEAFTDGPVTEQVRQARAEIANEFMAYYAAYSLFNRGGILGRGRLRYNNSLAPKQHKSAVGMMLGHVRRMFEGRMRDTFDDAFRFAEASEDVLTGFGKGKKTDQGLPANRYRNKTLDRFVRELYQTTKSSDDGGKNKVTLTGKKQGDFQQLYDVGLRSIFTAQGGKVGRVMTPTEVEQADSAKHERISKKLEELGVDESILIDGDEDGAANIGKAIKQSDSEQRKKILDAIGDVLAPEQLELSKALVESLDGNAGTVLSSIYWTATKSGHKNPNRRVYRTAGWDDKTLLPFALKMSKEGGIYFRALDVKAIRRRIAKARKADKNNLFATDEQAFERFRDVYLQELMKGEEAADTASALGSVEERNFFYEVLGTVPSAARGTGVRSPRKGYAAKRDKDYAIKNYRLDRVTRWEATGEVMPFSEEAYFAGQRNLKPTAADPSVKVGDGVVKIDNPNQERPVKLSGEILANMKASGKVNLYDHRDRNMLMLPADLMRVGDILVGPTGRQVVGSIQGEGGIGYMDLYNGLTGEVWAFTDIDNAQKFIDRALKYFPNAKSVLVGVAATHRRSSLGNRTSIELIGQNFDQAIASGVFTKKQVDELFKFTIDSVKNYKGNRKEVLTKVAKYDNIHDFDSFKKNAGRDGIRYDAFTGFLAKKLSNVNKGIELNAEVLKSVGMDLDSMADRFNDPLYNSVEYGDIIGVFEMDLTRPATTARHYAYKGAVFGKPIGYTKKFHNVRHLTSDKSIYANLKKVGGDKLKAAIGAQPLLAAQPKADLLKPYAEAQGRANFKASTVKPRSIAAVKKEVGMDRLPASSGAAKFGAFMRAMNDKGVTARDAVKAYTIVQSSFQRQAVLPKTVTKYWPEAEIDSGKQRPEDVFAMLLEKTEDGQAYLDAAEKGKFDERAARGVVERFRGFGFQNKQLEFMRLAAEQFSPIANELVSALDNMPTDKFIDWTEEKIQGIGASKTGFWATLMGRGDIPTLDSRQQKLHYGKKIAVTKDRLKQHMQRQEKMALKMPKNLQPYYQTLTHHAVWDKVNDENTLHAGIKSAMLHAKASTGEMNLYSQAERSAGKLKQKVGTGDQMIAAFKRDGVKDEELRDLGLDKFLKGKKRVTQEEIVEHLEANQIVIEEVMKHEDFVSSREIAKEDSDALGSIVANRIVDRQFEFKKTLNGYDAYRNNEIYGRDYRTENDASNSAYYVVLGEFEEANTAARTKMAEDAGMTVVEGGEELAPKYIEYTFGDTVNYREVLLRLPERFENVTDATYGEFRTVEGEALFLKEAKESGLVDRLDDGRVMSVVRDGGNEYLFRGMNLDDFRQLHRIATKHGGTLGKTWDAKQMVNEPFESGHYEESNVLAHMRLDDRRGPNGERVMFIEEIQSDWHQAGREHGYKKSFSLNPRNEAVPDAPFKSSWHDLTLRRALTMASAMGYDAIAWTRGFDQVLRYEADMRQKVGQISYYYGQAGRIYVDAWQGEGRTDKVFSGEFNHSDQMSTSPIDGKPRSLSQMFGKAIADKIVNTEDMRHVHSIKGDELTIGGEGMKGFYDGMLPKSKVLKRLKLKARTASLDGGKIKAHYVDIPEPTRQKIQDEGLPRYKPSAAEEVARDFDQAVVEFTEMPLREIGAMPKHFDRRFHVNTLVRRMLFGFSTDSHLRMIANSRKRGDADSVARYESEYKNLRDRLDFLVNYTLPDYVASLPTQRDAIDARDDRGIKVNPLLPLKQHFTGGEKRSLDEILRELRSVIGEDNMLTEIRNMVELTYDLYGGVSDQLLDDVYLADLGKTRDELRSSDMNMKPSDADYMRAIEADDMETAQRMVDEAAKAAGYNYGPVFHSTDAPKFDTFETPAYFSDVKKWTKSWGARTESAYLKITNPYLLNAEVDGRHFEWDADDVSDFKDQGFDGVVIERGSDPDIAEVYTIFDPSQVKSADPIIRDDAGNVIPLSERFNEASNDINYKPSGRMGAIQGDAGPVIRSVPLPVLKGKMRNIPTEAEALKALDKNKRAMGLAKNNVEDGRRVGLRIDIPAFTRNGIYVVSVHDHPNPLKNAGPPLGYDNYALVEGPLNFVVNEKFAYAIMQGEKTKSTIAVVEGLYKKVSEVPDGIEAWTQVGMNPKRHSYFYDRKTFRPVVGGDAAFSAGGTVFVKNAVFGEYEDFSYKPSSKPSRKPHVGPTSVRVDSGAFQTPSVRPKLSPHDDERERRPGASRRSR